MKVDLAEEAAGAGQGRKTWSLTVTIPANVMGLVGRFPDPDNPALKDTAIYLKAKGRRVRIPVSGTASQR
jgi:hypothetical protein